MKLLVLIPNYFNDNTCRMLDLSKDVLCRICINKVRVFYKIIYRENTDPVI
jgi:hypothetical protein